jgi:putative tryptophan/tyrosine transport system substrate-binding protein
LIERLVQLFRRRVPFTKSCRYFQILAGAFCVAICASLARAGDIVIVLSGDAAPYAQSETGLKKTFAEQKRPTRTLALQDVSTKGLDATVGKNADLVVAVGTPAALWFHGKLPATTPLVYCMVSDPVTAGLNAGRETHGVSTDVPLTVQFGLIAEAIPNGHTVGLLYRANTPEGQRLLTNVQGSLPKDWQVKAVAVDGQASIADTIEALMKQHVDVVWTTADPTIYDTASVRALLLASIRTNTPVFGFSPAFVKAGALLGIGIDPQAQGQQAANLGLRLLTRNNEAKLPAVNPTESYQSAVNLIVAGQIKLELPLGVVQRATYVFKESR